jgi:hypothetical protein
MSSEKYIPQPVALDFRVVGICVVGFLVGDEAIGFLVGGEAIGFFVGGEAIGFLVGGEANGFSAGFLVVVVDASLLRSFKKG